MFSVKSRETGHDGYDIEFRAVEPGGETVGAAYAAIDDDALRLDSIQAIPPRRGRGIGSALIMAVIAWGRERGASRISGEFRPDAFSTPEDVKAFYAKHGVGVDSEGNLVGNI